LIRLPVQIINPLGARNGGGLLRVVAGIPAAVTN
jgi:hypothetical protein